MGTGKHLAREAPAPVEARAARALVTSANKSQGYAKSKIITISIISSRSTCCLASTLLYIFIIFLLNFSGAQKAKLYLIFLISRFLQNSSFLLGTPIVFQIVLMVFMKEPKFQTNRFTHTDAAETRLACGALQQSEGCRTGVRRQRHHLCPIARMENACHCSSCSVCPAKQDRCRKAAPGQKESILC